MNVLEVQQPSLFSCQTAPRASPLSRIDRQQAATFMIYLTRASEREKFAAQPYVGVYSIATKAFKASFSSAVGSQLSSFEPLPSGECDSTDPLTLSPKCL
jgi:hypothetical protein